MATGNPMMEMQSAMRRNADDLRDELADLERWEAEIEAKEVGRKKRAPVDADLPPIRGTPKTTQPTKPKEDKVKVAKDEGNEYFRLCKYEEAVRAYTKGINQDPDSSTMHVLYANRAMCYLKLQIWDLAEKDATTCIQMNRTYAKAFYRRALARKALNKLRDARSDLETILVLSPGDAEASAELKTVTSLLVDQEKKFAASATGGGSGAQPAKKAKRLVIQEVDDEDDEAPAPAVSAPSGPSSVDAAELQREREARHRKDQETAAAAERARAAERKRAAELEEKQRQQQRKANSRVEVIESDDDEDEKRPTHPAPAPKEASPKPRHSDPEPRKVVTGLTLDKLVEPKSFIEFENNYNDIMKKEPTLLGAYLNKLPATKWKPVFGSSMTPEILADIFKATLAVELPQAVQALVGVSSLPRLSEVIMFMDSGDQKTGKTAVERALKAASGDETAALKRLASDL
jgi:tetratricopeptide (TPR) repeat protein